jgi:hypothetical protein
MSPMIGILFGELELQRVYALEYHEKTAYFLRKKCWRLSLVSKVSLVNYWTFFYYRIHSCCQEHLFSNVWMMKETVADLVIIILAVMFVNLPIKFLKNFTIKFIRN